MKTYIIYRHTLNNKHYIGYSSQTLEERLVEHVKSSIGNSERHFHRAIKKYGAENITSIVLDTADTRSESREKESYYIMLHDTFKNGYNMTQGGDGGNTKEGYTDEQMKEFGKVRSELSAGMNNGNARPDISIQNIVDIAVEYVIENQLFGLNVTKKELLSHLKKKIDISEETLRRRGIKNTITFIKMINEELQNKKLSPVLYDQYYRSEDEKKQLAKKASEYGWVTNGVNSLMVRKDEIDKYLTEHQEYKKGRTI